MVNNTNYKNLEIMEILHKSHKLNAKEEFNYSKLTKLN